MLESSCAGCAGLPRLGTKGAALPVLFGCICCAVVVHAHGAPCADILMLLCICRDLRVCLVLESPSLCPGAAFCALLLTTGTGKFLCRFVLGTARSKSCCGFTHLTQLPPQGYTPQPPQGFARPSYPRKGTLRNPRKGSLVPTLVHNTLLQTPTRVH